MKVKRRHEPQQIVRDLLNAEISERQARSIEYQMTIAKRPLPKEHNARSAWPPLCKACNLVKRGSSGSESTRILVAGGCGH